MKNFVKSTSRKKLDFDFTIFCSEHDTIKLAVKALLEVVQLGGKNLEIAVMAKGQPMRMMNLEEIEVYVKEIEEEKEKEAAQKKRERGTTESQS